MKRKIILILLIIIFGTSLSIYLWNRSRVKDSFITHGVRDLKIVKDRAYITLVNGERYIVDISNNKPIIVAFLEKDKIDKMNQNSYEPDSFGTIKDIKFIDNKVVVYYKDDRN